ncbi:hypothetical protein ACVU7I_06530, partial [Patulibacter sp. S7RM1-6]
MPHVPSPTRVDRRRPTALTVAATVALLLAVLAAVAPRARAADVRQPEDVVVAPGETAAFTAGSPDALGYTWYRVASPTDQRVASSVDTYRLVATQEDDGAQFYATFFLDGRVLTTRRATLTVGDGAPRIDAGPQDASALAGRPVRFAVTARGAAPLTYRWQRSPDGDAWTDVPGADGSTLELRPDAPDDGTRLRVVVDNDRGRPAVSAPATLTVRARTGTPEPVAHASLEWGINPIYQGGNPAGNGCNFFSAGKGSAFVARAGDVRIVHRTPAGRVAVSDGTKCLSDDGNRLGQRALFTEGVGTANPATGEATIRWTGAFTANAYGGLVPWYLEDPALAVAADGTGTLTATAGGKGAAMADPDNPFDVAPRRVIVATIPDVAVTDDGIEVTPAYAGVDYRPLVDGVRSSTSAIPEIVKAFEPGWGSWPTSFVDFQYETELSTYWHTSGLSADPDKAPDPFVVRFADAPAVAEVPAVVSGPTTTATSPLVEGRDVVYAAEVADATSVRWQRASSTGGPWTDLADGTDGVEGADGERLTLRAVGGGWNGAYLRLRATNAEGSAVTAAVRVTTKAAQPLGFATQPTDAVTIAGSQVQFKAQATGHPAPLAAGYGAEISRDGGATWAPAPGATRSSTTFTLPAVPRSEDGALVRFVARNADGDEARSRSARLRVVAATGGPQLVAVPSGGLDPARELDPTTETTLTVVGAGFDIPDAPSDGSYSLDLGVFTADAWQPGRTGHRDWLATSSGTSSGQLYQGALARSGGWFSVTLKIPAGTLRPGAVHGVGAFLRLTPKGTPRVDTFDDRRLDAWTGLPLAGQAAATIGRQPRDATLAPGETAVLDVTADGRPQPTLRWQRRRAGESAWTDLAGQTAGTLRYRVDAADDGAQLRAVADNGLGPAVSRAATLTVPHAVPDPGP